MGALIKGFKDGGQEKDCTDFATPRNEEVRISAPPPVEFQSIGMMLASAPITGTSVIISCMSIFGYSVKHDLEPLFPYRGPRQSEFIGSWPLDTSQMYSSSIQTVAVKFGG